MGQLSIQQFCATYRVGNYSKDQISFKLWYHKEPNMTIFKEFQFSSKVAVHILKEEQLQKMKMQFLWDIVKQ